MTVQFFNPEGTKDQAWLMFILIAALSKLIGKNPVFQGMGLPVITGYMIIGFVCGPFVLGLMNQTQTSELRYVNHAALSFIAFSAGAEIYLPEFIPLIKPILWISFFMILFTMVFGTLFTFLVGGSEILTWMSGYSSSCNLAISLLVATILSARSPTSVLAVVRELQARGTVTSTMIGITVGGDIIILTIFAIVKAMTGNLCSGASFDAPEFLVNLAMIPAAFAAGYLLGLILIFFLSFRRLKYLIFPTGFVTYLICDYILHKSEAEAKYEVDLDALLVCIAAGYVAGNSERHREKLIGYLKSLSMFVFIPFFTNVGLSLNLPVLINAIGFSVVACFVRAACMAAGTYCGGIKSGMASDIALRLWSGLLPQAGVSLGLAAIIGAQFEDTFGPSFQSTIIGIILLNQIIGPVGAKYVIKYAKEDGKGEEDEGHKHVFGALNDGLNADARETTFEMETQTEEHFFGDVDFTASSSVDNEGTGDIEMMSHTQRIMAHPPVIRYASRQRSGSFFAKASRRARGNSGDDGSHGSGWEKSSGVAARGRTESHGDYSIISTSSADLGDREKEKPSLGGDEESQVQAAAPTHTQTSPPAGRGRKSSFSAMAADMVEYLGDAI